MIYMKFDESIRDRFPEVPEYMCYTGSIDATPIQFRLRATYIFEFIGSNTVYYKNRTGDNYQYTGEEKVVIALKAVLL